MGDPGATWGIPVDGQWGFDHRYANMTAGDNIEDIGVGRLSGGTQATMATINAKIMQYERTPHMQTAAERQTRRGITSRFCTRGLRDLFPATG